MTEKKSLREKWISLGPVMQTTITLFTLGGMLFTGMSYYIDQVIAPGIADRIEIETVEKMRCLSIPRSGHFVETGAPGQDTVVNFNGLVRHRDDCGTPVLHALHSNGDNIWFRTPLSIDGRALPVGIHDMRYKFKIDPRSSPGIGHFVVTVTFPDAPGGTQTISSPEIAFNISEPN